MGEFLKEQEILTKFIKSVNGITITDCIDQYHDP